MSRSSGLVLATFHRAYAAHDAGLHTGFYIGTAARGRVEQDEKNTPLKDKLT